jgi:hypothetical protein
VAGPNNGGEREKERGERFFFPSLSPPVPFSLSSPSLFFSKAYDTRLLGDSATTPPGQATGVEQVEIDALAEDGEAQMKKVKNVAGEMVPAQNGCVLSFFCFLSVSFFLSLLSKRETESALAGGRGGCLSRRTGGGGEGAPKREGQSEKKRPPHARAHSPTPSLSSPLLSSLTRPLPSQPIIPPASSAPSSIYGSAWREQERRGAIAGAYLADFLGALPPTKGGAGSSNPFTAVSHSLGSFTVAVAGQLLYRAGGAAAGSGGRIRSWKLCAGALPDNSFAPGGRFTAAPALVAGGDPAAGVDVFFSDKDGKLSGPYERATGLTAMGRAGSTASGPAVPPTGAAITNIDTLATTGSTHNTQKGYFQAVGGARLMAGVATATAPRGA